MGYFSLDMDKTSESAIRNALANLRLFRETIDRMPKAEQDTHYVYLLDFIRGDLETALERIAASQKAVPA